MTQAATHTSGINRILQNLASSFPQNLAEPATNWPSEKLMQSLQETPFSEIDGQPLSQVLLGCAHRSHENTNIEQLQQILRSKIPLDVLDQLDFSIANHIVNQDQYLRWVIQIIGGWLRIEDGNCYCFNHALRHMPEGGAVIEIGSFLGASINVMSYMMIRYKRNNTLFNADPWLFEETENLIGGFYDASAPSCREYAKSTYINNTRTFSEKKLPHTIEALSDRFFDLWHQGTEVQDVFGRKIKLGGPISFAYIDGAHTYEAAKKDFENVDKHLLPGGFVLFDDSSAQAPFGCVRSAQEAAALPNYQKVFGGVQNLNVFLQKKS
jgi:hypothetical protein